MRMQTKSGLCRKEKKGPVVQVKDCEASVLMCNITEKGEQYDYLWI